MKQLKKEIYNFWNVGSCGEELYLNGLTLNDYKAHLEKRYQLEPYILEFADFSNVKGKKVLEIGVGLGAEHQLFAQQGAELSGIDLTERAIEHTRHRLFMLGLSSKLDVGDAENLNFNNESFDLVYSWGVIHHTPDTSKTIAEIHRVLKPGGEAKIMIYHKYSLVGMMLWLRYALCRLRPWLSLSKVYSMYLESPGTKAYSKSEAKKLFSDFREIKINIILSPGDLLLSGVGQRHSCKGLNFAKRIWPRSFFKKIFFKKRFIYAYSSKKVNYTTKLMPL